MPDESVFCQKCGTKLIGDNVEQQPVITPDSTPYGSVDQTPQQLPLTATQHQNQDYNPTMSQSTDSSNMSTVPYSPHYVNTPPKKSKKLLLVLIIIGAVLAIGITLFLVFWNDRGTRDSDATPVRINSETRDLSLSQTYINDAEGFTFNYPSEWEIHEWKNVGSIVELSVDHPITENEIIFISMTITKEFWLDPNEFLDNIEEEIHEEFSRLNDVETNVINLKDVDLNGILAHRLLYSLKDNNSYDYYLGYYYVVGNTIFTVEFHSPESLFDRYEPIFDAIMETYRITQSMDTSYTDLEWQTVSDGYFSVNIPSTWLWEMQDFDDYVLLHISCDNNSISMSIDDLHGGPEWYFNNSLNHSRFLFDDGINGYMIEMDGYICWYHWNEDTWEGSAGNLYFHSGSDSKVFQENKDLILQIARSFSESSSMSHVPAHQAPNTLQLLYEGLVYHDQSYLTINWENNTITSLYSDYYPDSFDIFWYMDGRSGNNRQVFPTFELQNNAVVIGFPETSTRLYYLYEDGTGVFGDEALTWSFFTWEDEIKLFG